MRYKRSRGEAFIGAVMILPMIFLLAFGGYIFFERAIRDNYIAVDIAAAIGTSIRVRCDQFPPGADINACLDGLQADVRDYAFQRNRKVDINLTKYSFLTGCLVYGATTDTAFSSTPSPYNCGNLSGATPIIPVSALAAQLGTIYIIEVYVKPLSSIYLWSPISQKVLVV
jgi:hypothetical protein